MTIKLEVGKQYVLNNGQVHTCKEVIREWSGGLVLEINGREYTESGETSIIYKDDVFSVSHEYTPQEGTLAELCVKEGDVVEFLDWRKVDYSNHIGKRMIGRIDGGVSFDYIDGFCPSVSHIFRLISRASDTPTIFRDMTDAEKGAVLLAITEGRVIQVMDGDSWVDAPAVIHYKFAYRIKPTPKVETVDVYGRDALGGGFEFGTNADYDQYTITFQTIDGKPDPSSIKMEEL